MKRSEFKARQEERKWAGMLLRRKGYNAEDIEQYFKSDAFKMVIKKRNINFVGIVVRDIDGTIRQMEV